MKRSFLVPLQLACVVAVVAVAVACDAPPEGEESPAAEACEHATEGPANAVEASDAADLTAGDVSAAHTRHDVTLLPLDVGDDNGGFVRLDSVGGPTLVFTTFDLPIVASGDDGAPIGLTAADESECAEVVKSFAGELPVGVVFLELGPTPASSVSLVIEAENAPDEEEGAE